MLNNSTLSKFCNKKWVEVNDLSSAPYSVDKNTRFKTSMLRSNLCDYNDAYIVKIKVLQVQIMVTKEIKSWLLRTMLHLDYAYQKLIKHL